eukprot:2235129-Rhodomonas_salina.6
MAGIGGARDIQAIEKLIGELEEAVDGRGGAALEKVRAFSNADDQEMEAREGDEVESQAAEGVIECAWEAKRAGRSRHDG